MSQLKMPSFGADMDAGTLIQWLVKPGDRVAKGDIVAVIETMKGAIEMEVFEDGTIEALLVNEGDQVPVGTPIASVATAHTAPSAASDTPVQPAPVAVDVTAALAPLQRPASDARQTPQTPQTPQTVSAPIAGGQRIKASPLARARAQTHHLNLGLITGSGPQGAVVLADIERARGGAAKTETPAAAGKTADRGQAMRQAIAAAMSRSKREIPHYYLETTLDLSATLAWLEAHNRTRSPEQRVLLGALLVKATASALLQTPQLNGYFVDGEFTPGSGIHIGMAIKLRGGGLVVPALLHADRQSVNELMTRLRDLTDRARRGGLRSSEMSAATVTVTSLGDLGVESVYGVIFPPQVAILGFGTPCKRPWVTTEGDIEARTLIRVTLAADHRVSDGHLGARFLRILEQQLQAPPSS